MQVKGFCFFSHVTPLLLLGVNALSTILGFEAKLIFGDGLTQKTVLVLYSNLDGPVVLYGGHFTSVEANSFPD